jgi:hypothetical protein
MVAKILFLEEKEPAINGNPPKIHTDVFLSSGDCSSGDGLVRSSLL